MQMTLTIDDDVLAVAEAMAQQQNKSLDEVISDLARMSIDLTRPRPTRNGIPILPKMPGSVPVTLEKVNALRDSEA